MHVRAHTHKHTRMYICTLDLHFITSGEAVTVDPANKEVKRSGDPPEQPITLESAQPQAPLEPVVKIITGPKGKSNG